MKPVRIEIVSKTDSEVVALSEVKSFCYVDLDVDDTLLTAMTKAAIEKFESYCRRPVLEQTSRLWFDCPVGGTVFTPFGKLASVSSVKYYEDDNSESTEPSSNYFVDTTSDMEGRIHFKYAVQGTRDINSVSIEIVNGWSSAESVPSLVKEGIKSLIAFWYENREMYGSSKLPADVKTKWNPYRIVRV